MNLVQNVKSSLLKLSYWFLHMQIFQCAETTTFLWVWHCKIDLLYRAGAETHISITASRRCAANSLELPILILLHLFSFSIADIFDPHLAGRKNTKTAIFDQTFTGFAR